MDWREKVMWGAVGLVLVSWGLEIFDVWSLLIAHLTRSNWITCVLIYPAVLLGLIGASTNASKGTMPRVQMLLVTAIVIMSWSWTFSLIGKVGR